MLRLELRVLSANSPVVLPPHRLGGTHKRGAPYSSRRALLPKPKSLRAPRASVRRHPHFESTLGVERDKGELANSRGTRCSRSGTCRGAAPLSGAFGVAAPQTRLQAPWLTGAPSSAPPTPPARGHQFALRSEASKSRCARLGRPFATTRISNLRWGKDDGSCLDSPPAASIVQALGGPRVESPAVTG
jgi:hypothetical protein